MSEDWEVLLNQRDALDALPYPLTVFTSRYQGTYEGGWCIALNEHPGSDVVASATGSDVECATWYANYERYKPIGRGRTHEAAIQDLKAKLEVEPDKAWPEFTWRQTQVWW